MRAWVVGLMVGLGTSGTAWGSACDVGANDTRLRCGGPAVQTFVSDIAGMSPVPGGLSDAVDAYACTSDPQDRPERVLSFQCDVTGLTTIRMYDTQCDLDLFVLDDTCDPSDHASCVAFNTLPYNSGPTFDVSFVCEAGRTYTVFVEGWAIGRLLVTQCPNLCVNGVGGTCTGGYVKRASNLKLLAICAEDCTDGEDDDHDGKIDCEDPDCLADPACAPPTQEDCDRTGDEDGDGLADCDDPDCADAAACCDVDGDGVWADVAFCGFGGDCDDDDPGVHPGAPEIVADGIDQDCDGGDDCWLDADGDGFGAPGVRTASEDLDCDDPSESATADDCGPADPTRYPGAPEIPYDGIDQDCDGADLVDVDGDGFPGGSGGTDCNDRNPAVRPGAVEIPNGVDDDCDRIVDEGGRHFDDDGDGYTEAGGDCDDADPTRHPGAPELPNGIDDDCDGIVDEGTVRYDDDGDGWCESGCEKEGDCHDGDASIHPGATELPGSGVDKNCDGVLVGVDRDGDGFTVYGGDCDDDDPTRHPGAREVVNGKDDDCDGRIDNGTEVYDDDGDGACESTTLPCVNASVGGDCDDTRYDRSPFATEDPTNFIDDDCDGLVDEGGRHFDDDGDGYTEAGGDCDDADPTVHPYARETEDGRDEDCDGLIDEDFIDLDGDGFTVAAGDCDDRNGWANPGRHEVCDGIDNDCDGRVDEGCRDREDEEELVDPPRERGCSAVPGGGPGLLGLLALFALRRRR